MKSKIIIILLLITGIYSESYGQTTKSASDNSNSMSFSNLNEGWTLYGKIGVRKLSVEASNLYLYFVDDSPSRDNITTSVNIRESNLSVDLAGGVIKTFNHNLTGFAEFDFIIGRVRGWKLETGIGYEFSLADGRFIPNFNIGLMGTTKYLGDIWNNDVYIQINDVKMYSDIAKVYYENTFFTLKPQLTYISKSVTAKNLNIIANIGYNIAFSGRPSLSFTGENEYDEPVTGVKSLYSNNIKQFEINGIHTTSTIVDGSGIIFNIGLALNI